jgi:type I restriction enzyme S subunit
MSLTRHPTEIVENSSSSLVAKHPDWPRVPLGSVATVLNGAAFKSKLFDPDDGVPLIRIRDISRSETSTRYSGEYDDRYLIKPGELLVGMDGDFNVARWRGAAALLNQRVCRISPDTKMLNLDFLTYVLPGYLQAIHDVTSSTTVKHLSSRDIADIPVPIPALADQERIAARLVELDSHQASIAVHLKAARTLVDRLHSAVLAAACSGRLTEDWRDEQPDVSAVEVIPGSNGVSPLFQIPDSWRWSSLDSVAEIRGGVQVGTKTRAAEFLREVPYLRVANVQRGWLDLSEIKTIAASEDKIAALRLQPGDVLFTEGGDRDKLGRGWVWGGQIDECIHQNHVFRARLYNSEFEPRFYSWFGNSFGMRYFIDEGKQTVNLASLSKKRLGRLPVPVPPPAEQSEIVRRVDAMLATADRLAIQIEQAESTLDRVLRASLGKAFRGELVPTEAALAGEEGRDFESTEELLARVKSNKIDRSENGRSR